MIDAAAAAWIAIAAPLAGAAAAPLLGRVSLRACGAAAVACSFVAAGAALRLLALLGAPEALPVESRFVWLEAPVAIGFGVLIDPLGIVLANVVAVVSAVIMVYCLGYVRDDPARARFWAWMNGFVGSMLLLVLSSNLLLLFVGWKLVGVCSYGLIGYYYRDQRAHWIGGPPPDPFVTPSEAGLKALVVTGFGDMLMMGGILILYFHAGTLNFLELYETAPAWLPALGAAPGMMALVCVLLLAGPIGKSAQFPLHEWLPEAMAGPGPVSALIHAATMVKSGVYLVARLAPLFYVGRWVLEIESAAWFFHVAAWTGAFTALLAATQGMVALELKKVLACSTVSQIGYMMLGLGVAGLAPGLLIDGYAAGLLHLISHALFKACLFLCAGTIIHAVGSIYVHEMGGARRRLPFTWVCTVVAAAALVGLPPLPGFWSKDAVLLAAAAASLPLFALALVTVALTAFYTVRCIGLVFHGPPQGEPAAHGERGEHGGHAGDGSAAMRAAAGGLALATILAGLGGPWLEAGVRHGVEAGLTAALPAGTLLADSGATDGGLSHAAVSTLALLCILAGAAPAWVLYGARKASPAALLEAYRPAEALRLLFWRRWGIDAFYRRAFVDGTQRLARWAAHDVEDRFDRLVNRRLPQAFVDGTAGLLRRLRTETDALAGNMGYVLVFLALLLAALLLGPDGGR